MSKIVDFFKKYKHAFVLLAMPVMYASYFVIQLITEPVWFVWAPLDDKIPFVPGFVVFYFVWYLYIALPLIWFVFADKNDFYRMAFFLMSGMFICHVIFLAIPNAVDFRPPYSAVEGPGIFNWLLRIVYGADGPRNVFPSLHCFNSAAIHITMCHSKTGRRHKWLRPVSALLVVGICLSTVFIKQHSVLDVAAGLGIAVPLIFVFYNKRWFFNRETPDAALGSE